MTMLPLPVSPVPLSKHLVLGSSVWSLTLDLWERRTARLLHVHSALNAVSSSSEHKLNELGVEGQVQADNWMESSVLVRRGFSGGQEGRLGHQRTI